MVIFFIIMVYIVDKNMLKNGKYIHKHTMKKFISLLPSLP